MHSLGLDGERQGQKIEKLIEESCEARLRSLSTTHFGLSSPVMNVPRLQTGANLVHTAVEKAVRAFKLAAESAFEGAENAGSVEFALFDYMRGVSTETVKYEEKPSRALVRIPLAVPDPAIINPKLSDAGGKVRPAAIRHIGGEHGAANAELLFIENMDGGERKDFRIDFVGGADEGLFVRKPVSIKENVLENEFITFQFDENMQSVGLACSGVKVADGPFIRSAVNYAGRVTEILRWTILETGVLGNGLVGLVKVKGETGGEKRVRVEREFMLAAGLPYLHVNVCVTYPETRSAHYDKDRARALEQEYDGNWREVMPCEIRPALFGQRGKPLRVWKHNYIGHVSHYDLNYGEFSKNEEIDSFNNHITHAWVAVTDGDKGLLVAQTADVNASFAFCPMRTRMARQGTRIFLNPFGSYHGKQLSYATSFTGLGKFLAVQMAESLDPFAPSYNGHTEDFSLLIAPYSGDEPPKEIRYDAEAFAYPYGIVSRSEMIRSPRHRRWVYPDVGGWL